MQIRTANRCHAHSLAFQSQLIDYFRHKTVYDPMGAAGAVVQRHIAQGMGSVKYSFHNM